MRRLLTIALTVVLVGGLACSDDESGPTGPTTGSIEVLLNLTGEDLDPDGCQLSVDGGSPRAIVGGGSVTFSGLEAGTHSVRLDDVSSNCTVQGANPRSVSVTAGTTTPVTFSATCSATTGSLEVTAVTTGEDVDPDGYTVTVNGSLSQSLGPNGTVTFSNLPTANSQIHLTGVAENCTVSGSNPRPVTVVFAATEHTTFSVECVARTGSVRVTAVTTGQDFDDDGYQVFFDGVGTSPLIAVNGDTMTISNVAERTHEVRLGHVTPNCAVTPPNPRDVQVSYGLTTEVVFEVECQTALRAVLDSMVAAYGIPALAAVTVHRGQVVEMGAAGRRAVGYPEPVTENDLWHVGSLTKAMTATLTAVLVERGVVSWDTTVGQVLPDLVASIREEFVDVRLDELLYHTAGLVVRISSAPSWSSLFTDQSPIIEQRRRFAAELLALPPDSERGTYRYTNAGYIVAGAMLEEITGESWEALVEREVFNPLGMRSMGFGAPGSSGSRDQPWGHTGSAGNYRPVYGDNPAACGPAGTVHTTLADYSHFMVEHLAGTRGQGVLASAQAFEKLHTPAPGSNYAMGWVEGQRSWANGRVLTHNGSNNLWYAVVWLAPERELGFFAVTNAADTAARSATNEAIGVLIQRFEASQGRGQASALGKASPALEVE